MCQILIFDAEAPTDHKVIEDAIEDSQLANGDGSGVAWIERRRVSYVKGTDLRAKVIADIVATRARPVVVHTRLRTSGARNDALCHPFPIDTSNRHAGTCGAVLFHNGIVGGWRMLAALLGIRTDGDGWSDTKVLAMAVRRFGIDAMIAAVKADGGDRLAILRPSGVQTVGHWHRERGILVSSSFPTFHSKIEPAWYGWDDSRTVYRFPSSTAPARSRIDEMLLWCPRCQRSHKGPLCPKGGVQ